MATGVWMAAAATSAGTPAGAPAAVSTGAGGAIAAVPLAFLALATTLPVAAAAGGGTAAAPVPTLECVSNDSLFS